MAIDRLRGRALQRQRQNHFREFPLCVMCEAKGKTTEAAQLDHIHAIINGGDKRGPVQGLCLDCHAEKTQADLGYRVKRKIGPDGYPED